MSSLAFAAQPVKAERALDTLGRLQLGVLERRVELSAHKKEGIVLS